MNRPYNYFLFARLACRGERRSPKKGRPAGRPYKQSHRFGDFLRVHQDLESLKNQKKYIKSWAGIKSKKICDPGKGRLGVCPGKNTAFGFLKYKIRLISFLPENMLK
jgi:hypothetical protein